MPFLRGGQADARMQHSSDIALPLFLVLPLRRCLRYIQPKITLVCVDDVFTLPSSASLSFPFCSWPGIPRGSNGVSVYVSKLLPSLVNESEAALFDILPASEAELHKLSDIDMKLLAAVAAGDVRSAKQDAKIAELESRLNNVEVNTV